MHPQRRGSIAHTGEIHNTHLPYRGNLATDRRENTKLGGIYNLTRATVKNISRWTFVFSEEVDKRLSYGPKGQNTQYINSVKAHTCGKTTIIVYIAIPAVKAHTCDILTW